MVNAAAGVRKRLGEILVERGLITEDQLQSGLRQQQIIGGLLGEHLVDLGYLGEKDLMTAISLQFNLPYVDLDRFRIAKEHLTLVSTEFMVQNRCLLLDRLGKTLLIAVAGNLDITVYEELEKKLGVEVFLCIAEVGALTALQGRLFSAPMETE